MSATSRGFALLDEPRSVTYAIVFGIWAEVFIYCLIHDLYLVRIAPALFTEYHPPLWGIENHSLLAAAWAFRASVGPGLGLGLVALFLARAGSRPKIAPGTLLRIVPRVILVTEATGLILGSVAWQTGRTIYPDAVYPDFSPAMIVAQTIQITCYAVGALGSTAFLGWIVWRRRTA